MNGKQSPLERALMAWTMFTTVFVWLPLMRALARPEGYYWSFFGVSGEGLEGPIWIFALLSIWALAIFVVRRYGPRRLLLLLVGIWHLSWTSLLVNAALRHSGARWQGQGWRWEVPIWLAVIPFTLFLIATLVWISRELRSAPEGASAPWSRRNSRRLAVGLALLPAAFLLFRWGTNYNWVTALAIGVTIVQWITLLEAFDSLHSADPDLSSASLSEAEGT